MGYSIVLVGRSRRRYEKQVGMVFVYRIDVLTHSSRCRRGCL